MLRSVTSVCAFAAAIALVPQAASANLTIPINFTVSNSVQAFTADDLGSFDLVGIKVEPRGTGYEAKAGTPGETNGIINPAAVGFPITKIVIGSKLNIVSGSAVGSALYFARSDDDTGESLGLTLANFTINYDLKKVLADVTAKGGKVSKQQAIYTFVAVTPLALKYRFPVSITGHEVLGSLFLTPETKASFKNSLHLPDFADGALEFDFGTLTQDISLKLRSRPISATPYVAN
ncbi:MAG TPA: hypothetical protein VFW93_10840 [Aquabacterium sp.]|uniref:hypothetical protein n=1 Tax=Aquabacterium sp. TaxID=1872578 RepID=UPI002E32B179|nr:hypothetical protein [Aquabacterium sp.]HEX5356707.1 hypothetical protein [Aquabacterium sp.]